MAFFCTDCARDKFQSLHSLHCALNIGQARFPVNSVDRAGRPRGGIMSYVAQRVPNAFENPAAGGKAQGDFLGLLMNLATNGWKMDQASKAKQSLRRALNDAVYALGRRPEGYYVAIVMVTRDISAGSQQKMIQFISGSARNPAPVGAFSKHHWRQMEPIGNRQHLIVVHNVQGVCPMNLPAGSMNLEDARATLQKF
ncbi:MAG: hypothetical protein ACRC6I_12380 [Paracoccaceae bacterium]